MYINVYRPNIFVFLCVYIYRYMASSGLTCKYTHCLLTLIYKDVNARSRLCVPVARKSTVSCLFVPALDAVCLCLQQRNKEYVHHSVHLTRFN